jgi:hypothetical protein
MQALKGRDKPLSPFQGLHQFCQVSRGYARSARFTPGYYLSRFQRSESHVSNRPQNPTGLANLKFQFQNPSFTDHTITRQFGYHFVRVSELSQYFSRMLPQRRRRRSHFTRRGRQFHSRRDLFDSS